MFLCECFLYGCVDGELILCGGVYVVGLYLFWMFLKWLFDFEEYFVY